jgi:hypothetical protein
VTLRKNTEEKGQRKGLRVVWVERMKHGSGIKDRDDKSSGIEIRSPTFGCRADSSVCRQLNRTEVSCLGSPQPRFNSFFFGSHRVQTQHDPGTVKWSMSRWWAGVDKIRDYRVGVLWPRHVLGCWKVRDLHCLLFKKKKEVFFQNDWDVFCSNLVTEEIPVRLPQQYRECYMTTSFLV